MRTLRIAVIATAAVAAFLSCTNQDKQLTIADQEAAIDNYVAQNFAENPVSYHNGSVRVTIIDSSFIAPPDSLVYGDTLSFFYAGYVFTNGPSDLFSTNNKAVAAQNNFSLTDSDSTAKELVFTKDCMVPGLVNGLYGVKERGHYIILFSAEHGFYDRYVYNIPKLSALAFEVWIEAVRKKETQ
ncbi:MAG TPA: hypothetical protein IAC04_04570 [Candidatus Coprenecus stercoravium]|uniref:peptidylprolyl isomerase n=1 Tax=Candidatus Coprenecus stercoravium TaxID=2840735 RepID=A0A9D2KA02_9BACT|nr:hypothetical protein [Candidatus Coprenecus stercoravium]